MFEVEYVGCSMFGNQVHLPQPVLKLHTITGNIFPAYFNDSMSACLSVCVCVCVPVCVWPLKWPHVRHVIYWMFLRHNVFIQLHFIQPYNKTLQSRQQYSRVFWNSFEMCVFPLYLSFQLSYDPDGTTVLCRKLSQKVSDGVRGKHTSA